MTHKVPICQSGKHMIRTTASTVLSLMLLVPFVPFGCLEESNSTKASLQKPSTGPATEKPKEKAIISIRNEADLAGLEKLHGLVQLRLIIYAPKISPESW